MSDGLSLLSVQQGRVGMQLIYNWMISLKLAIKQNKSYLRKSQVWMRYNLFYLQTIFAYYFLIDKKGNDTKLCDIHKSFICDL